MWPTDISNIDFERILKWVVIVLITGFIAQFGKSFAAYVMEKIRTRKTLERQEQDSVDNRQAPQWPTPSPRRDSAEGLEPETVKDVTSPEEKVQAKLQKKELKAQIKKQKKDEGKA
jgi:hypothetical protein